MAARLSPLSPLTPHRFDPIFGGTCRVADICSELGTPGKYKIRLYHRSSGKCVRETFSDAATGAYAFERIIYESEGYFVVAFDHGADPVNAAIGDYITPELMTS